MEETYISSRKGDPQRSLWQQYVAGNKSVFGELYTYYHRSLTAYCIGMVGSVASAENVASDTLIKLLQHPNPGEIENFESWLFAVAKNECLTFLSKSGRRKKLLDENYRVANEYQPEVEVRFSLENLDQVIRETLDTRDYKIWQLHQQGYDNREIAEIIDSTEKTVANRKSAARIKLKSVLNELNNR